MNVSTAGNCVARNTAAAASLLAKAATGTFVSLVGVNTGAAQYILVFDAAALPANADATALFRFAVADGTTTPQNFSLTFTFGVPCNSGIVVCNSSTIASKTLGSANCYFSVVYR